jgi:DNA-binding transcriptional ArsR family regulator
MLASTEMDDAGLARMMKVLSVGTRVRIARLLKGRTLCVNALAGRLGVTQGAVSQHLRVMRDAGLVVDERCGYYVHYRLNEATVKAWREAIDELLDVGPTPARSRKGTPKCAAAATRASAGSRRN